MKNVCRIRTVWLIVVCTLTMFSLGNAAQAEGRKAGGVKKPSYWDSFTDSTIGSFVAPSERNKRDRERIMSVLAHQRAISYDTDGKVIIVDQKKLDSYYKSLQSNGALNNVYGFAGREGEDKHGEKSGQFWQNFFDGKDHTRGDTPATLDPFENNSRGLATKMHSQLTTATDDASSDYTTTAGDLKVRGIDVMDNELRRGTAAGADAFIKAMDVLTAGQSTRTVEWAEEAAEYAKQVENDPAGAASSYIKGKIQDEINDRMTDGLKKALGEDRYEEMMEKYESAGDEHARVKKMLEDMAKVTGDPRIKEAAKKMDTFAPDSLAEELKNKLLPPELGGKAEKKPEDGKAADKDADKKEDDKQKGDEETGDKEKGDAAKGETSDDEKKDVTDGKKVEEGANPDDGKTEDGKAEDAEPKGEGDEKEAEPEEKPGEKDLTNEEPRDVTTDRKGRDKTAREPASDTDDGPDAESAEENETSDAEDAEPDAAPAEPETTTDVKGWVEDSKGRITITEERDKDGRLVKEVHTQTDKDGNVIGETTYEGGQGEGIPGRGGKEKKELNDLKSAEGTSVIPDESGDDSEDADDGESGLDAFANRRNADRQNRVEGARSSMESHTRVAEATNEGYEDDLRSKNIVNAAGEAGSQIRRDATDKAAAEQDKNRMGTTMADAIATGLEKGIEQTGTALGKSLANEASKEIFGPKKSDDGKKSKGSPSGGGTQVASKGSSPGTSSGGSSGGKKTSSKSSSSGKSLPASSSSSASPGASSSDDGAASSAPSGETSAPASSGSSGRSGFVCKDCGGTTTRTENVYDKASDTILVNCLVCGSCGSPNIKSVESESTPAPAPAPPPPPPKKTRDGCGVEGCGAPVTYQNDHYLYGSVYKCANGHTIKGRDVIQVEE